MVPRAEFRYGGVNDEDAMAERRKLYQCCVCLRSAAKSCILEVGELATTYLSCSLDSRILHMLDSPLATDVRRSG